MSNNVIKVLTLNCWGAPNAKHIEERLKAICEKISSEDYDIVALQEIFFESEISIINQKTAKSLPYNHYFYNNYMGSGIYVLSKYRIRNIVFVPYKHSGMPCEKTFDYFSGKGIGYCEILHPFRNIKVIALHLHANYYSNDFSPRRTLQLHQIASFVKACVKETDYFLLMGDLNTEYDEIGLKYLLATCGLHDSCTQVYGIKSKEINTFGDPSNSFASKLDKPVRLDYILYNSNFTCWASGISFEKLFNEKISYSDHYGYQAKLAFNLTDNKMDRPRISYKYVNELVDEFQKGIEQSKMSTIFVIFPIIMLFLFLISFILHVKKNDFYLIILLLLLWTVFVLSIPILLIVKSGSINQKMDYLSSIKELKPEKDLSIIN